MSYYCYVCDCNFSASENRECPGCNTYLNLEKCSNWSGIPKLKLTKKERWALKRINCYVWTSSMDLYSNIRSDIMRVEYVKFTEKSTYFVSKTSNMTSETHNILSCFDTKEESLKYLRKDFFKRFNKKIKEAKEDGN